MARPLAILLSIAVAVSGLNVAWHLHMVAEHGSHTAAPASFTHTHGGHTHTHYGTSCTHADGGQDQHDHSDPDPCQHDGLPGDDPQNGHDGHEGHGSCDVCDMLLALCGVSLPAPATPHVRVVRASVSFEHDDFMSISIDVVRTRGPPLSRLEIV